MVPTAAEYGGAKATREAAETRERIDRVIVRPYPILGDPGFLEEVVRTLSSGYDRSLFLSR